MCGQDAFFHYLPVNEETMTWGMYVTGLGRAIDSSRRTLSTERPSGAVSIRLGPRTDAARVSVGAAHRTARANLSRKPRATCGSKGRALLFLFPGVWHRYRPDPKVGWDERWISFNGELLHRLFDIALFGPRLAVATPHDPQGLAARWDHMLAAVQRHIGAASGGAHLPSAEHDFRRGFGPNRRRARRGRSAERHVGRKPKLDDPIVQRALELIWTHSHYPMSVSDIARQLPVTRRTLDRRFVEATGHSVLDEINACRLSRAKRLLAETDLPVKTVARLAGFSSTERLRVTFVEREGISPTIFRKQSSADAAGCGRDSGPLGGSGAIGIRCNESWATVRFDSLT